MKQGIHIHAYCRVVDDCGGINLTCAVVRPAQRVSKVDVTSDVRIVLTHTREVRRLLRTIGVHRVNLRQTVKRGAHGEPQLQAIAHFHARVARRDVVKRVHVLVFDYTAALALNLGHELNLEQSELRGITHSCRARVHIRIGLMVLLSRRVRHHAAVGIRHRTAKVGLGAVLNQRHLQLHTLKALLGHIGTRGVIPLDA